MSMAAFKKELLEYKANQKALSASFLTIDASTHPLIFKWRNSEKNTELYTSIAQSIDAISDQNQRYAILRYLARYDLFFLLWKILNRKDVLHPWLIDRCHEVQAAPNHNLDLWAREHYKSTIITFALSIQDILTSHGFNPDPKWNGREVTIGIFSCTRPIAKAFLSQIKREFESNELLKELFPDILWSNPSKDAPKWSEDAGLVIKRKSNPKEATIEAWGVVEGQPTSKHFYICVYDDLVTKDHVNSPYMIKKVIESWEVSTNLGTEGGAQRYIGTRYHLNDPYATMIRRTVVNVRLYPPTKDGSLTDNPVLKSKEELEEKLKKMGTYTYGCQMMQNPRVDEAAGFKLDWLQYHDITDWSNLNRYILVDPANEKSKDSDYTAMMVIGLGEDKNYYVLDMIRDRMNLGERAQALIKLHKKYKPLAVGYERYGMQADTFYIQEECKRINYNFKITELGGNLNKFDRIRRLVPLYEAGRFYIPTKCIKTDYQKVTQNLTQIFIEEEFYPFPVCAHDDMLDCMARILEKLKIKDGEKDFAQFPEGDDVDYSYFINRIGGL